MQQSETAVAAERVLILGVHDAGGGRECNLSFIENWVLSIFR